MAEGFLLRQGSKTEEEEKFKFYTTIAQSSVPISSTLMVTKEEGENIE